MSILTAKFVGGPLDGQLREMRPENKPSTVATEEEPPTLVQAYGVQGGELRTLNYERRVSQKDSGPLWEYHFVPAADA